MIFLLCLVLFMCSVYLLQRGSVTSIVFGLIILGTAANLVIFNAADVEFAGFPFITAQDLPPEIATDPLPQALILTAIVIGFALMAYLAALARKVISINASNAVGIRPEEDNRDE